MSISLSNALCLERARNRLTCCSCVACHGEVECTHPSVSLVICYRDPLSCLDHFFCRQYVTVDHYIMKYGCHLWNPVFFHNKILVLTLWVTSRWTLASGNNSWRIWKMISLVYNAGRYPISKILFSPKCICICNFENLCENLYRRCFERVPSTDFKVDTWDLKNDNFCL